MNLSNVVNVMLRSRYNVSYSEIVFISSIRKPGRLSYQFEMTHSQIIFISLMLNTGLKQVMLVFILPQRHLFPCGGH